MFYYHYFMKSRKVFLDDKAKSSGVFAVSEKIFYSFNNSYTVLFTFRLKRGAPNSSVTCSSKAYPPTTVGHTPAHLPTRLEKSINPRNSSSKVCITLRCYESQLIDGIHMKMESLWNLIYKPKYFCNSLQFLLQFLQNSPGYGYFFRHCAAVTADSITRLHCNN